MEFCSSYHCAGDCGLRHPGTWMDRPARHNPPMALTTAERQRAFKESQKAAGYVRLEAYVTKEQREKFRSLGGDAWLREKINAAKVKNAPER